MSSHAAGEFHERRTSVRRSQSAHAAHKSQGRGRKLLWSLAALAAAAGIAGLGTYATFTSTTSASQTTTAGTVTIALGATGAATNRLNVNATGLVPGDTIQRSVNLINSGNQNLASITLTTAASPSSLLDSDATNGLQMVVDKCSVAWTEAGSTPAFTYTCSGTTSSVLATRAVIGSAIALSNLGATTAAATDFLRVTLTFPSGAPNTLQGLTSTITYTFNGTQRVATNQ
jgi:predicted ribosomally synthesized peptide with SipW-like signal peptide